MNPQNLPQPSQNPAEPDGTPFKTDIVNNIPMHSAGGPPAPAKEDENLDKIMQDVGHELKKDDVKPAKHHFFSKKDTAEAQVHQAPPTNGLQQQTAQNHQPITKPQTKPKPEHNAPVAVIIVTVIVTAILIAVTYWVYSK